MIERTKSARWGWYLYDFANSILVINGSLYFPQWIVGERNAIGDLWFNLAFVISSMLLILSAPFVGLVSDKKNSPFKLLKISSFTLVLGGVGVGISPYIDTHELRVSLALGSFLIVLISYQTSLIFYNTLLGNVASRKTYAAVSGRALAWGWIGGILAVAASLPFALGLFPAIAEMAGMASILPSVLITSILVLISLHMIGKNVENPERESPLPGKGLSFVTEMRALLKNTTAIYFLLGFFFFSDAILTLQNNSTIYMENVIGFTDDQKAYQFIIVLITGAIGALLSVSIIERLGLLAALKAILFAWVLVVAATPISSNGVYFTVGFAIIGLLNGAIWNVSRVLFFQIAPALRRGTYFGFYASFERFASIVGPMVWSLPVTLMSAESALRYQIAWGAMAIFLVFGIAFISRIPNAAVARESMS